MSSVKEKKVSRIDTQPSTLKELADAKRQLAHRIRNSREQLGLSQSSVSARLGVSSDSYLSRVEHGQQLPSKAHLKPLSEVLEICPELLIEEYLRVCECLLRMEVLK